MSSGLMYYPLPAPVRLLDTRGNQAGIGSPNACTVNNSQPIIGGLNNGTPILQQGRDICTIPANAVAITGNVIPVPVPVSPPSWGYLTLWPSDAAQPTIATTNYGTNEILNNVFTVGIGTDKKFKIYSSRNTHVVIDVTGYCALPPTPPAHGGLYFHPLSKPVRLLETRAGQPGCHNTSAQFPNGILGNTSLTQQAWGVCDGATIPDAARAIVGNVTSIAPSGPGFLTLWPAHETKPLYVASTNYNGGAAEVVNTPFTTGLSPVGEFKIFAHTTTQLTLDVLGYYSQEPNDVNGAGLLFNPLAHPVRLLETRPGLPVGCFKPGLEYVGGQEYTQSARGTCDGLNIPYDAMAIMGNATVVFPGSSGGQSNGALTLWRNGLTRPAAPDRTASNYLQGAILNRYFTVGLAATDGMFRIHSTANTHLVVDVVGFFAPPPPPAPTVILNRAPVSVPAGGTTKIKATWSVTSGTVNGLDWIGLYLVGTPNADIGPRERWEYTNGASSGSLEFAAPQQPGTYEFRYLLNDGFTSVANSATINVFQPDYALERLDPVNRVGEPGEDLLSGNYNWHLPLVSLPGRAGLDLNLGLTYNSRVWTKAGPYIGFDVDDNFAGPGFRLGFPEITSTVYHRYDTQPPTPFYLLTLPSGRRVELRNNMAGFGSSATNIYESVDSSRLRLKVHTLLPGQLNPEMTLYSPDDTRMFFQLTSKGYRCTKITDRNGNYISATYISATGAIANVTDTLGRVINFKYDGANHLKKIYRCKNNGTCNDGNSTEVDYTWAMFEWNRTLNISNPNFQAGLNPTGTGSYLAFRRVILNDGTYYEFTYTTLGQLQQIDYKNPSDTKLLNRVFYTFQTGPPADCPRFTQRKDSAYNWLDASDPAIRNYNWNATCLNCITGQVVLPAGSLGAGGTTLSETYALNSWQRGLLLKSSVKESVNGAEKKKTELLWTQDNLALTVICHK